MKLFINILNIFFVISILTTVLSFYATSTNKSFFGYMYLQVLTESMDAEPTDYEIKSLKVNDFIIVKEISEYNKLLVGDVITFQMNEGSYKGVTVTHRIIDIDGSIITTKGDANTKTEVLDITKDVIYGKVIYNNLVIGKILNVIKSKYFLITFITIPCILIVLKEGVVIFKSIKGKEGI